MFLLNTVHNKLIPNTEIHHLNVEVVKRGSTGPYTVVLPNVAAVLNGLMRLLALKNQISLLRKLTLLEVIVKPSLSNSAT